jgi:heme A synthase
MCCIGRKDYAMETVESSSLKRPTRAFFMLALTTAALTLGLIVFGAVVRVTDSGLGCGNHWPLCNGSIFPPLDNLTAWIEWLHRLFALLIGVFGLITLGMAFYSYRQNDRVLFFTSAAAILFVVQSALGAMVVLMDLPPTFVTLHLGVAMLLFAALIAAAVFSRYQATAAESDQVTTLAYTNAAFALLIILTGALVRGSGATLACTEWPLCIGGTLIPTALGELAVIHMLHRLAVAAFGLTLVILVWQVFRTRSDGFARSLAAGALIAYGLQAAIGAMYVFSVAAPIWGAAHVGMAAATWGILVVLCVVETMKNNEWHSRQKKEGKWNPQSNAA